MRSPESHLIYETSFYKTNIFTGVHGHVTRTRSVRVGKLERSTKFDGEYYRALPGYDGIVPLYCVAIVSVLWVLPQIAVFRECYIPL